MANRFCKGTALRRASERLSVAVVFSVGSCRISGWITALPPLQEEKIARARAYARVMREEARLDSFVRLVDYMYTEGLISRAIGKAVRCYRFRVL